MGPFPSLPYPTYLPTFHPSTIHPASLSWQEIFPRLSFSPTSNSLILLLQFTRLRLRPHLPSLHNLQRSTNTCCDNRVLFATFLSYTFLTSHRNSTAGPSFRSISRSENMSYYDNQQWPASGQPTWEQQTPPARSGMLTGDRSGMDRSIDRRCRRQLGRSTRGDRSLHDTNRGG